MRKLGLQDYCEVFPLLERSTQELGLPVPASIAVKSALKEFGELYGEVYYAEGRAVGYLGYGIVRALSTSQPIARIVSIYFEPDHRGILPVKAIREFEEDAIARGCLYLNMGVPTSAPQSTHKLFHRLGYAPVEVAYVKEID